MTTQAMKSTKVRAAVYLLLALLVLVMTTQVLARGSTATPTNEEELTGVVTAITPTTVTIGVMTFDIAQAEVQATILVGDMVKVHYTVATDGTLVAREVQFAVDVTLEATAEATDGLEAEDTPEATEAFDDHGHDNAATHVEDQHTGRTNSSQNRGSGNSGSPVSTATQIADDHGQDGTNTQQQSQSTPQPHQEDHGGNHGSGGGDHGGHGN